MNSVQANLMRKLPRDLIEVMSFSKFTTGISVHSKVNDVVKSCDVEPSSINPRTQRLRSCKTLDMDGWASTTRARSDPYTCQYSAGKGGKPSKTLDVLS
jgi:hypothetical protein